MITQVDKQTLINHVAEKLQDRITPPPWAQFVKTGAGKERPPQDKDWWYKRAASILMKVEKLGPIGVSKLSVHYGNKKNRGMQPEKFYRGGRKIIRTTLQQLEEENLVEQDERGVHKGRMITQEGLDLINDTANEIREEDGQE